MRQESENPEIPRGEPPSAPPWPLRRWLIGGGIAGVAIAIIVVATGPLYQPRDDSGAGASVASTDEQGGRDQFYGFRYGTLTMDLASQRRIDRVNGVIVTEVRSNSPVEKAGMQVDDVIVAVDGVPVIVWSQVSDRLRLTSPGQQVSFTVERGGATRTHTVTAARCLVRDPAEPNRARSCKSWTN